MGKTVEIDDSFDFGFSMVDESELEVLQQAMTQIEHASEEVEALDKKASELEGRLNKMYNMVLPLLNNLSANPEKTHIHWPNRLAKIKQFRDALDKLHKGS